ncbi:MAG: MopE-related protein, partial [Myxococcota bacterium]
MRLAPLLVLAACQDTGVKVHNTEPEVVFTDPVLALSVRSSEAVTFVANVEDGQTPTEDLTLVWASGSEGALEGTQALADTIVTFTVASFSAGEHVVTLTAIDADGASGSDAVTLDVTDNAPPAVAFSSPAEGDVLVASAPVAVSLVVSDEDDDLADVVLAWGGVAAGSADAPTAAAADGTASFDLPDLPAGSYTLSVSATDPHGDVATAEVGFTLVEGDLDSDGHVDVALGGDDCDDGDGGVHPGADERCDGVDEDCDGRTDEDAIDVVTVYDDGDGDGYGDAATEVVTCSPADGTVEGAGDCDDLDGAVHPAANEACNGVDDDCDGVTDVLGDADGDGWDFCDECDDGNPDVSPSAVEVCNGLDDDCDGATDGPDSADAATWYTDGDGDGYGDPDAPVRECSQPAGTLSDDSDCLDSDATVNPDGEETCNDGVDNDCDGDENGCGVRGVELVADAQAKLVGESGNDGAGSAVAGVGDFDGDGLGDLVVGADGAGTDAGAAYVVLGLPGDLDLAGADVALTGTSDGDEAGTAVGPAGDVDADGLYDVFVGAPGEDAGGTGAGAAYVITAAMSSGTLAGADVKLEGVDAGDAVGT